jgi:2-oxoglutarate dehydrogenase complex dehydrogenase (E1) component-like enzyme
MAAIQANTLVGVPHGQPGELGRVSDRHLQVLPGVPSTPANYFHLLRRHGLDGIHRPLIVATPKSMPRTKAAVSDLKEVTEGKFRSVYEEPTYEEGTGDRNKVKRLLLTSGKVYYELVARKNKDQRDDMATCASSSSPRRRGDG